MTYSCVRYILLIIFILLSSLGYSQQAGNPFEVFHTKKYKDTSINKEINLENVNDNSKEQKLESIIDPFKNIDSTIIKNLSVDNNDLDTPSSLENPFSVDHTSELSSIIQDSTINSFETDSSVVLHERDGEFGSTSIVSIPDNPFEVVTTPANKLNKKQKSTLEKSIERVESSPITKERIKEGSSFIFWIIFLTIFLFAILINYKRSFILKSYRGILNENYLKLIKKEENNGFSFFFISLFIVFLFSISSFIYLYLDKIQNINIGFLLFVKIFFGLLIIYLLRSVFMRFMGYIFNLKVPFEKYFFIVIYFNILLGIALIAINIGFAFGSDIFVEYSFYGGLVLVAFSLLIRYLRGLLMSIQYNFLFKMQFIFYLCAVEIAPVFVILKLIESHNGSFL